MFRPTGSVIQLMDGRVFKRNQRNLWEDINTGVTITEQQLNLMVSSASFSSDASGGGRTNRKSSAPLGPATSLSAQFDDIVEIFDSTVTGTNRNIVTTEDPVTLTVNFEAGGLYSGSVIMAYKNDTTQVMNFRTPSNIASPSPRILSETFANGDQLKFAVQKGGSDLPTDYDVTIQKTAPGSTQVLDTFNVSYVVP